MKKISFKLNFLSVILFGIIGNNSFSQSTVLGNNFVPGAFLGWNQAQPLDFHTSGTPRMRLTAGGFLGIGLANPSNMLHIHDGVNSFLQVTTTGIGNSATDGLKVGMLSTSTNAIIANQEAGRLLFATSGAFIGNTRMTITAAGLVGIGTNFINPNNLLDVNGGDIDVDQTAFGYMIGDLHVLKRNSGIGDGIYVGVGAGSGPQCTFLGYNSGNVNGGNKNTFT